MTGALIGRNLTVRYGDRQVLHNVSVAVPAGQVVALLGPSGCGKTTLLWALAGLIRPAAGQVLIGDAPAAGGGGDGRPVQFPSPDFGMVFQQPALWEHLSVQKHLDLVLSGRGLRRPQRRQRVEEMLSRLNLAHLRGRRPGQLSGGERQRLAIARALVVQAKWLLLDEPLAHLDGPARTDLLETLRNLLGATQAGVLVSTHEPNDAMRVAGQIVILSGGSVVQCGPAAEVYHAPACLGAALALGPASEISGVADGGRLLRDGVAAMEGIDPKWRGHAHLILRPAEVEFVEDPSGPAVVVGLEWSAGAYSLKVAATGATVLVYHDRQAALGTRGRLRLARAWRRPG